MALVVENGTGLANAESYISVANADARHSAFGNTAWAAISTTALKESYLRQATAYMVQAYRERWSGIRINATQALDWPRAQVVVDGYSIDSDAVPADIANACADLALKAASAALAPDLERAVVRKKIGPLETEYSPHSPQAKRYRAIDMALAPYLKGSSAMAMLVRA
jgi:hypothetical protein